MGLDMYLYAEKYVSGYNFSKDKHEYLKLLQTFGLTLPDIPGDSPSATVRFTVAYWRKANAIHGWFVEHVQGGSDECQTAGVSREQLQKLVDLCREAIAHQDSTKLPTLGGFFFGDTDIGEWYWADLQSTVDQVDAVLSNPKFQDWDFYYHSSW